MVNFSKSGDKPLCSITTRNLMMKWIAANLSQKPLITDLV